MSAAAGALALASVLPPSASGVTPPPGAASDPAPSPFDGLLAGEGESAALESEPLAKVEPVAVDAAASLSTAVDAALPPTPAAAPAPAMPPPMDDPATRSVLNALALRVATESQGAAAPVGLRAAAGSASEAVPVGAVPLPAIAAATPGSPSTPASVAAAPIDGALLAAAAAFGAPLQGTRAAPAATMPGATLAPAGDAVPSDGDRAGTLDALLSSLEALLPSPPAKPVSAPATPAVAAAPAAAAAPQPSPLAVPATPPVPSGAAPVTDAASTLLESAASDAGAEATANQNLQAAVSPPTGNPASFAGQLANATGMPHAAARADGSQPPINVPFDSPQWGNELATRVVSLAKEQFSEAEIRVTPDELGPIEVKLRFDGDRVHAQFGAISPEAREALTANLHRLREMLAGEGLNLGQAFVGHHGQDAPRRFEGQAARSGGGGGEDDDVSTVEVRGPATLRRGLLDEFA